MTKLGKCKSELPRCSCGAWPVWREVVGLDWCDSCGPCCHGVCVCRVERLGEKASIMGTEAEAQSKSLAELDEDMTKVAERLDTINENLKGVLKEVRDSDKFCMDVCCILFLLGCVGVFFQMM